VIDTNVTGTIYLIQKIARDMRTRGQGRILITGSIAGFMPGTYHAVYNGTKAFIDSFPFALRAELKDTGVTVTCLMPGATETEFFERAGHDRHEGWSGKKGRSCRCRTGRIRSHDARGRRCGQWMEEQAQSAIANVTPAEILAEQHRKKAEPGSGTVTSHKK
jgi:short-subunit dehydrogenase